MEGWRGWLKQAYGKRLIRLHAWNAWVLLLAVTGLMLYLPWLRGKIALFRVELKALHIGLGLLSLVLLLLYLPLLGKHVKRIWRKRSQQFNLWLVLLLIIGWGVSGILLWQDRQLPKGVSIIALFWF